MFTIITPRAVAHNGGKRKVTCLTCKLKKCVGRCNFQPVECPQAPKAA